MQTNSVICLENAKAVTLHKYETRRFSEADNTNSSTSYIPNSMGGMKPAPKWGVNITCVRGWVVNVAWRLAKRISWHSASTAVLQEWAHLCLIGLISRIIFRNGKGTWGGKKKKHLRSSFPLRCSPNSFVTITKDQWQVFMKRKSIWVTLLLKMYLNCINIEVIYKLQIILCWYPPCALPLLLVGKPHKTIRDENLRHWRLEPQLLEETPTCAAHILIL